MAPTRSLRTWLRPGDHAAVAAWTVLATALADGALAISRATEPLIGNVERATLALAIGLAVVVALACAALAALVAVIARAQLVDPEQGGLRIRRLLLTAAGLVAAVGVVAFGLLDLSEVEWRGVDQGLFVLPVFAVVVYVAMLALIRRVPAIAGPVGLLAAVVSGVAGGAAFLAADPADRGEALAIVDDASAVSRRFAQVATRRLDHDGDGHPRILCGQTCDCDDGDVAIGPLAAEIVGNGIDEDCDGEDASAEQQAAIEAAFAKPEPTPEPTPAADAPPAEPPNILLITIDTLRADHLGVYGYERATSPNIDAWAKDAVVFEQARSTGPSTRFSMPPMMVGKWFTEIERDRWEWPHISDDETMLAERLSAHGYTSIAFHSIRYFRPSYNFNQGFQYYSDKAMDERGPMLRMVSSDYITDEALAWVDKNDLASKRPFFMWAYYGDPHAQYIRHSDVPTFGSEYRDVYDNEIAFVDKHVGRLLAGLKERGQDENLIVIVHADHGEALDTEKDHGQLYHSKNLHDELIHIPLIVSGPTFAARRVTTPVSLLDFTPTVLQLVGAPADPSQRGVSLVPYLRGEDPPHPPLFFEKHRAIDDPQKGMLAWPYKVILTVPTGRMQIFDLAADPRETKNILGSLPDDERKRLTGMMRHWASKVLDAYHPEYRH